LKATTPVMLTPLAVLIGLLIAFVASRIWGNYDRADALVRDEARAIQAALTLGERLPPKILTEMRSSIQHYLQFTIDEDWPAMLQGRAKMRATVPGLTDAMSTILSFAPTDASQQLTQQPRSLRSSRRSMRGGTESCLATLLLRPCSGSQLSSLQCRCF
jgi:hypothetical protein